MGFSSSYIVPVVAGARTQLHCTVLTIHLRLHNIARERSNIAYLQRLKGFCYSMKDANKIVVRREVWNSTIAHENSNGI